MKIALYGGSFDPPHNGHIDVINKALNALDIDKLIIVPAYRNPFKQKVYATTSQRLKWLQTLFNNSEKVEVSDFEIKQNRSVTSYETVTHYQTQYETIYFIIGADNLKGLSRWHQFDYLNTHLTWVVATRNGIMIPNAMMRLNVNVDISSSDIRSYLDHEHIPDAIFDDVYTTYKEFD